jgi:hypothetical protein
MATTSLVLGIVSFLCLGVVTGVLAVIFGVMGLNRAKQGASGHGQAVAGIACGAVGFGLFVAEFAFTSVHGGIFF